MSKARRVKTHWGAVADWYDQLVGEAGSDFHEHVVLPGVLRLLAVQPGERVAVVGLPSAEWGETVVAFVVGAPDLAELRDLAVAELAPFKRPRELRLVEAPPRNALGKVVRKELR